MRVGDSAIALYIQNHFKNLLTSLLLFAIGVFGGSLYCVTMPASETESLRTVFTGAQGLFSVSECLRCEGMAERVERHVLAFGSLKNRRELLSARTGIAWHIFVFIRRWEQPL